VEDELKAKRQLVNELARFREKVARLEASERRHRKLERASQKGRDLLMSILENAPYGVGLAQRAFGRILYQNPEFTNITGYTLDDLRTVRRWLLKAYPDPEYRHWIIEDWKRIQTSDRASAVVHITCKDGSVKDVELKTVPLTDGKTLNTFADVTRRERAEAALRKAQEELESRVEERTLELLAANKQLKEEIASREKTEHALEESRQQLRSLSQHLQSAREEERKRIAREVHDELGQALSVLKIDVRCLGDTVNGDNGPLREQIEAIAGGLDVTVQTVRKICAELRPAMLYHFGLPAAIEWQAREFQKKTGIECTVELGSEEMDLDHEVGLAVFRMFQEALTNIMRHAGADRVKVGLVKDDEALTLRVQDNGKGITKKDISNPGSFGIIGMIERARFWDGTVQFKGVPHKGTTVTVHIPVN
jgi:PAS domain S-box-containing protein